MKRPVSSEQLYQRLLAKGRLRQFQMILAVAHLGSTHHASRELGVSQPAITKVIHDVEKDLGFTLFERLARGMKLTPFGQEIVPLLRRMLQTAEMCAEASAVKHNTSSTIVRIGAVAAGLGGLLAPHLPAFSTVCPDLHLKVHEIDGRQIDGFVAQGEYDVFACRKPETLPDAWVFLPMMPDEHIIVASTDHPLAQCCGITIEQLSNCVWLQTPEGIPGDGLFETLFPNDPKPELCQIAARSPVIVREALRQRNALAFVPASIFGSDIASGSLRRIDFQLNSPLAPLGLLLRREAEGEALERLTDYFVSEVSLIPSEEISS